MILSENVINYIWYLDVTIHDDDTLTINKHWRMHRNRDENHPAAGGSFRILETNPGRIASQVRVGNKEYKVTNPRNVFDYK